MTCITRAAIDHWWPWSELDGWREVHHWPPNAGWHPVPCQCGRWPSVDASLRDLRRRRAMKA